MFLDVILVLIIIGSAFYGYTKGGIKVVSKLVSFIISIVMAYMFAKSLGGYIANTSFGINISSNIQNKVDGYFQNENNIENNSENINNVNKIINSLTQNIQSNNSEIIVNKINSYIFTGLGFIVIFIGTRVILFILTKFLDNLFELPILKTINRLSGAILSIILTVFEIHIVLAFISFLSPVNIMDNVIKTIETSVITKIIYEHNIINYIIYNKFLR